MTAPDDHVVWFADAECGDVAVAGGKGASLATMARAGLPVPPGFVVGAPALEAALSATGGLETVRETLKRLGRNSDVGGIAAELQTIVRSSPPQGGLAEVILAAYNRLGGDVAIRSSACAEDGDTASYAGQQETFLNVAGPDSVLDRITACWSSFFAERALFYRRAKGSIADMGMAVVVQRLLDADRAGVMFTIDPVRRRRDQMVIEAVWGLGEAVVSGSVTPDQYIVTRSGVVKHAHVASQTTMVRRADGGGVVEGEVDPERAAAPVLGETEIQALVSLGLQAEELFGGPQDVEWAIAGTELYLLQSRPVTA